MNSRDKKLRQERRDFQNARRVENHRKKKHVPYKGYIKRTREGDGT